MSVSILIPIVPFIFQVFNSTFYGIVDSWLALSMDMNDFVHMNLA